MSPATTHLLGLLVVSWIYLTLVRFVDINEREPVWSLGLAFVLGCVAAALLSLLVNPVTRVLVPWVGAAAEEIAKGVAYVACLLIFTAVARIRGWFELSDLVDGIVYGIAIGLGFSAGNTFLRDLAFGAGVIVEPLGQSIINSALVGLGHGLFGGITGLGVGVAVEAHGKVRRLLFPLLGLAGAIGLNWLFRILAHGNGLDSQATLFRAWLAVLIPLIGLLIIGLVGLSRERSTIARHLSAEVSSGLVTTEDLALLRSFWSRQTQYMRFLAAGKFHEALTAAGRHNRQVQLALAKARVEGEPDGPHVSSLNRQIDALRRAVRHTSPLILILLLIVPLSGALAIVLPPQDTMPSAGVIRVLGIAVPSIDAYWKKQIMFYTTPTVGPYSTSSSVCPFQKNNAVFCRPDGNIYYDPAFLNGMYDSIGDFAPVVVMAHEWGHKVQSLRGAMQNSAGQWTIVRELQADCYAGEWVRDVERGNGTNLEKGDLGEALEALNQGRDPRGNPWYDPQAHGTGGQRVDAFQAGREGVSCTSDSLWTEVHLDPAASQQTAAPATGSLIAETARRKGRFTLVDIRPITNMVTPNRTEVVRAIYRAPDGSEVLVDRGAFVSPGAAANELVADSTFYGNKAYKVSNQGPVKDGETVIGRWVALLGEKQVVLITNRQTFSLMSGPEGITWEFATATVP